MKQYLLAFDQGTSSSALFIDRRGHIVASAQQEFPQHCPLLAGSNKMPKIFGKVNWR